MRASTRPLHISLVWEPATISLNVLYNGRPVLDESLVLLRQWWEETSYRLERLQVNPDCAEEERLNCLDRPGPGYHLPFTPQPTPLSVLQAADKPRVAH